MKKKEYSSGAGLTAAGLVLMMSVFLAAETLADSLRGWAAAAALLAAAFLMMAVGQRRAEQEARR